MTMYMSQSVRDILEKALGVHENHIQMGEAGNILRMTLRQLKNNRNIGEVMPSSVDVSRFRTHCAADKPVFGGRP